MHYITLPETLVGRRTITHRAWIRNGKSASVC